MGRVQHCRQIRPEGPQASPEARSSQVEMAYRFGIDRGHISDLERGKKNVCLPMLEVLSKGFEVSVSELMRGV